MANTLKLKRGLDSAATGFTPAAGEPIFITDTNELRIGDGSTLVQNLTPIGASPDLSAYVQGPASATDNAIARFDATTGKLVQNSVVTIADTTGDMAGVGTLNTHTIQGGTGTLALTSDIPSLTGYAQYADATANFTGNLQENGTDVALSTDITNMVETTDTNVTGWGFIIDEDNMSSDSATKIPTQQSVKAYVDAVAASEMTYKGSYDASTDPNSSAAVGDMYTVTVGGTGATSYWSTALEIGDMIIAETNNPASEADWSVVQSGGQAYALAARNINTAANSGLAGGGDLTADRSLTVDASNLTADTTLDGSTDYVIAQTAAGTRKVIVNNYLDMGVF